MASGMRRAKMRDLPHRLDYAALSNCDKQPLKPDSTKPLLKHILQRTASTATSSGISACDRVSAFHPRVRLPRNTLGPDR